MTYIITKGVIETDLENEMVLLHPKNREMYSLNETGRIIWKSLEAHGLDGAVNQVTNTFDIDIDQAKKDAEALLADLIKADFISVNS